MSLVNHANCIDTTSSAVSATPDEFVNQLAFRRPIYDYGKLVQTLT